MIQAMPVQTAKQNLDKLLEPLHLGDTITLTNEAGMPLAIVVSLNAPQEGQSKVNWIEREKLAEEIGRAWTSNKSAVESIAEMRR